MMLLIIAALIAVQPPPEVFTIAACAAAGLSPADRQAVGAALLRHEAPGTQQLAALSEQVAQCSVNALAETQTIALRAAVTSISQDAYRQDLSRLGIDHRAVDRWYERQSDALRGSFRMIAEEGQATHDGLVAAGIPIALVDAHPEEIGGYVSMLVVGERLRRGLRTDE